MRKLKRLVLLMIMLVFFASPLMVGCDFTFNATGKLKAPELTLNEENKCLVWDNVKNATSYVIYCNNEVVDNVDATEQKTIVYELIGLLEDSGTYVFEVVAISDSLYISNSNSSNSVIYEYNKKPINVPDTPSEEIDTARNISFTVSSEGQLSYIPLDLEDCEYYLYLYSNTTGLKTYPLNSYTVNLMSNNYITKNEIYAIRLGYVKDGVSTIASQLQYFNPSSYGTYTTNIYLFDGYINDYYIEDIQELKNVVYYSFINRQEEYDIKISPSFKTFVNSSFEGSHIVEMMDEAVYYCHKQFYETMSYSANNTNGSFVSQLSNSTEFKVKVSYGGVSQCDTTINPSVLSIYNQSISDAYYEIKDFETLQEEYGDSYDNFVSDKQFLYTTVTTSEQLYWAIENKVTPVITNTDCRAYQIYRKAKQVLREIISDDMTDYEKALCIFDWICINTKYDYTSYTVANGYSSLIAQYPTKLPCFYLEGVFITGNAVCDGFSKAYSMMCNMIGIDAIRIVGDAVTGTATGGHAWNKVLIDIDPEDSIPAEYYIVDITWTEIISNYGEELTHTYFGLGDSDIANTHTPYSGRKDKFDGYKSPTNLRFYEYSTFEYEGTDYDLVISNNDELTKMFDYMLIDIRGAMEVVIDYNYMVAEYEKIHGVGTYKSSTKVDTEYTEIDGQSLLLSKYDHATDTFYYYEWQNTGTLWYPNYQSIEHVYYNYELRNEFIQKVMKPHKFQEQYLFLADDDKEFVYNDNGDKGLLYILTQNLLLDAEGEVTHLVSYLDQKDIYGSFTLYVKDSILSPANGTTYLEKIADLFASDLGESNIDIFFELVKTTHVVDSSLTASIYTITVSEKVSA